MTDFTVYAGEDFALQVSATTDDGQQAEDISGYDALIMLSTTPGGHKIIASTKNENPDYLHIIRIDNSTLSFNVPNTLSRRLSDGEITLDIMFRHKHTGVQIINTIKTISVKQSLISGYEG